MKVATSVNLFSEAARYDAAKSFQKIKTIKNETQHFRNKFENEINCEIYFSEHKCGLG